MINRTNAKRLRLIGLPAGLIALLLLAQPSQAHEPKTGKKIELVGTVIDIACFVGHGSSGEKHAACAEACARAGNPLAILDAKSGQIYLPISMDHKDPNAKLMPFIEKKVKLSGVSLDRAGVKGIVIQTIEGAD